MNTEQAARQWDGQMATPEHYQRAIVRLTAELRAVKESLADLQVEHKREVGALKAQLAEGLSLEVLTLRRSVSQWRTRAQAAEARLREVRKQGGRV